MKKQSHIFSIRKSVYGAVSVIVATGLFIGEAHSVHADEISPEPLEQQAYETTAIVQTDEAAVESRYIASEMTSQQETGQAKEKLGQQQAKVYAPIDTRLSETVSERDYNQTVDAANASSMPVSVSENREIVTLQKNDMQSNTSTIEVSEEDVKEAEKGLAQNTKAVEVHEKEQASIQENGDNKTAAATLKKTASPVVTANPEQPLNQHPFVFVHGFMGLVGEVAPKGMNYWGGTKANLQEHLRNKGYEMYEASVSALASNHERAVDLYHYIVGGRADYGAAHAEKYGHERYGKTYKGIYPDWQPGNPIHLIGHSMGGQTIRLLEHYLRNGNQEELVYQQQHGGTISPLYQGGHEDMVTSITTIATPHNGTHAADQLGNTPFIRHLLYGFTRTFGNHAGTIDLGMYHWGFKQRVGESLIDYGKRVAQSQLWDSEDTALYDLTTAGAEQLNEKVSVNPNIYYKTFSGQATHKTLSGKHMIDFGMAFAHVLTGNLIGSVAEEIWRPNDGLVSVVSAQYPKGEAHVDVTTDAPLQKGVWQVMPTMAGWDHSDFIGNDTLDSKHSAKQLTDFYDELTDYLMRIEAEKEIATA
ncbi:YSIRK-targeted triacylglycerol lipase [Staphylococcus americanisciuri]|uniref:triacylglycerol lipase n=1 Tax=Staphylococcus americanisciuri TaxID=2973940 RepID=A0ABT2F504_9STAP|nr:YSIRK-type signal peptide-containing protein [Staphylococcus americanisciuri]MCS4487106.1 YSIRK-type signal peptide-containing protein [Staphylococcus americanisciuri]